jgi:hypothetical protein
VQQRRDFGRLRGGASALLRDAHPLIEIGACAHHVKTPHRISHDLRLRKCLSSTSRA